MNCRWITSILFASLCLRISAEEAPKEVAETWKAQDEASSTYWEKKAIAQREYRRRTSEIILKADKIEVFLLDFSMPETEGSHVTGIEAFPIVPFQKETRILKKVEIQPADLKVFREAIASALAEKEGEGGVFCHYPIHGIKVFRANVPIFQTSLCWNCWNYYFEFPDGVSFQQMNGHFAQLKELLEKHVPIPPEEVKRFKQAMAKANGEKKSGDGTKE